MNLCVCVCIIYITRSGEIGTSHMTWKFGCPSAMEIWWYVQILIQRAVNGNSRG